MNECSFFDPDAETIMKKKLLPQVIKMLLKLGDGGGDRKMSFSECSCLSVLAEDLAASILLDFVGMATKILSLVECIDDMRNKSDEIGNSQSQNQNNDENT